MITKGRELMLYLAVHYKGEWEAIYRAIERRETIDQEELGKLLMDFHTPYLTILDEEYPAELKSIYKPPFVLFYYGNISLLKEPSIAIVGSRECSEYGKRACFQLIKEMRKKLVILSGLAKGIDTAAHKAALKENIPTIAILGSGIDYCYPKENQELYNLIKEKGLILSEYPLDTSPEKHHFPERNRLIAALSKALLVVEASCHSGTAYTIQAALEFGKDIFCVPHPIDEENNYTNRLIQDGAVLVTKGEDILKELKME